MQLKRVVYLTLWIPLLNMQIQLPALELGNHCFIHETSDSSDNEYWYPG